MRKNEAWKDGNDGKGSGPLPNCGNSFFLNLAAECIRELKHVKDINGLSYKRKEMIMTGMLLGSNGS